MGKTAPLTFVAAFAPGRKCVQVDTDGEVTITLVVPETDGPKILAAFQVLKDIEFTVSIAAKK